MKNKLSELRELRGLSQNAVANKLNVSRQIIISIEKGRFNPSLPLHLKSRKIFGLTIEDIFDPEDEG